MTASGQSRRFDRRPLTSGLARSADILRVIQHVSKVPNSEVGSTAISRLSGLRPRLQSARLKIGIAAPLFHPGFDLPQKLISRQG